VTTSNMTTEQKEQMLRFFFYNLTSDLRGRLMCELPMAYNAACQKEIVRVRRVSDDMDMDPPLNGCEAMHGQAPWHYRSPKPE
jgi:hypothetical protein